jgi:hypothetical protein
VLPEIGLVGADNRRFVEALPLAGADSTAAHSER